MQSVEKIEMSRFRFLTTIFIAMLALWTGVSATAATADSAESKRALAKKYEPLMISPAAGEVAIQTMRLKIAALSKSEIAEFIEASKPWFHGTYNQYQRAIFSFDVLRKHKDFDKSSALQMLKVLKEVRVDRPIEQSKSLEPIAEKRLYLFLAVKAGQFDAMRADAELKLISDAKRDSVERVGMAGALVDAMTEVGMKPTIQQLEKLLKNDISDIRILAVDWFALSPPANAAERTRFLSSAFKTNPRQVTEGAQRACAADTSPVVREVCAKAKVAADTP